jgi:[protein-PII] uridylyltransferase
MSSLTPAACRERIRLAREAVFDFTGKPFTPQAALTDFSDAIDALLREIYAAFIDQPGPDSRVSLIALGGYGRQEMFPFSDVDILILHDHAQAPEKIGAMVRFFWDTGLTIGCAVRTIGECRKIMEEDIATDTAFLENRLLAGNAVLHQSLLDKVILPHFRSRRISFIAEMQEGIREGLYSPLTTLFKIEPNIKNGTCGLRDCQRLWWAERVRHGCRAMAEVRRLSPFLVRHGDELMGRYAFLAALRLSLHSHCGRRVDILETVFQPAVAQQCGYGPEGAGRLMEEYFRSVRDVRRILLSYLERTTRLRRALRSASLMIGGNRPIPGIALYNGILFHVTATKTRYSDPVWIMTVFNTALTCHATLSTDLCEHISRASALLGSEDFKSQKIGQLVRTMLSFEGPVGRIFSQMHDTGVLAKLIPAFEELTCKVEYDSYHEYTVDQHILLTLSASDELAADPDEAIRAVYRGLPRRMLLRLALLLHDIGKALPGDHTVNGAVIAEAVCERLGLDEEETGRVCLLVHLHLALHNLALREPQEEPLREFARQVADRENLEMLYLLTIVDIRCVGQKTWTGWKAFQLQQQFERLLPLLSTAADTRESRSIQLDHELSYETGTLQEERERYRQWLAEIGQGDTIGLHGEQYRGFERITVCGNDRLGFLTDIIGCLTSEGYNILSARVYTVPGGKALDIFSVEPPEMPAIPQEKRLANVTRKWGRLAAHETRADELIRERLQKYPLQQLRGVQEQRVSVRADNSVSPRHTIIEVDTADNFGLLYTIAKCLSEHHLNIVAARLSTRIERVVDVFYVTTLTGEKVTDETLLSRLCDDLQKALA